MRLLVTTSHSILLASPLSGEVERIHQGRGLYYGLAKREGIVYVAARGRMVSSALPAAQESGEILLFDSSLNLSDVWTAPFPLRDMHQIAWIDDRLFVTCSFDNMVAIRDSKQNWRQWYPLDTDAPPGKDINHYNTLAVDGDAIVIVAHNLDRPSEILFFDRCNLRLRHRITLGRQAHNVWLEGGEYFTCSSAEGAVMGHCATRIDVGGFPRGVAKVGKYRVIGVSELAERHDRDFTDGALRVFDASTSVWAAVGDMSLPGEGLVLDILPL
jgi:hypothetical protein